MKFQIIKSMEMPGIDPGTSRMLSERSTIWATPPCIYAQLLSIMNLVLWSILWSANPFIQYTIYKLQIEMYTRSYGVMAITLDFESNNPSSNLGRTLLFIWYDDFGKW